MVINVLYFLVRVGLDKLLKKILKKKLEPFKPLIDSVEEKVVSKVKEHLKKLPIPEITLEVIRSMDPVSTQNSQSTSFNLFPVHCKHYS